MRKIAQCGLLVALALVLSLVERLIPLQLIVPIAGIKLGLANIVLLFALIMLDIKQTAIIFICRIVLSSIFAGSFTGFLFSFLGGLLSVTVMYILLKWEGKLFSFYGISIAGAACHNIGQIIAAIFVLNSVYIVAYLPILLICSFPLGLITGYTAKLVINHLKHLHLSV